MRKPQTCTIYCRFRIREILYVVGIQNAGTRGNYLEIGRFEPSSKMCGCGVINKELKLSDRIWTCKSCGSINDRDILAANNILKFALNPKE